MDEVREKDRVKTFLKAVVEFNNGASKVECTVKNISATGARLDITGAVSLPDRFNLHIPHRKKVYQSKLVWRENDTIGVHFVTEIDQAFPSETLRSPTDLEAENERLRRRVNELTQRLIYIGQDPAVIEKGD